MKVVISIKDSKFGTSFNQSQNTLFLLDQYMVSSTCDRHVAPVPRHPGDSSLNQQSMSFASSLVHRESAHHPPSEGAFCKLLFRFLISARAQQGLLWIICLLSQGGRPGGWSGVGGGGLCCPTSYYIWQQVTCIALFFVSFCCESLSFIPAFLIPLFLTFSVSLRSVVARSAHDTGLLPH